MRHRPAICPLGLAVLALALAPTLASPAFAAERPGRSELSSAWSGSGAWLAAIKAAGCLLLPGGFCAAAFGEAPTTDYGCLIDPSGVPRCGASGLTQPGEYGCLIDPNGARRCGPNGAAQLEADYGCSIDPNGLRRCSSAATNP